MYIFLFLLLEHFDDDDDDDDFNVIVGGGVWMWIASVLYKVVFGRRGWI